MINQYIRDPELSKRWDTQDPVIRKHHQRMISGWIAMADEMRAQIQQGHAYQMGFHNWIWGNVNRMMEDEALKVGGDCETDFIVDAYLEWGVRNYPITDRITEYTLQSLERLYMSVSDDGEAMMWDDYIAEVHKIAEHQSQRNRKPLEKMNRVELMRWMNDQPEETIRKMAASVEYQNQ